MYFSFSEYNVADTTDFIDTIQNVINSEAFNYLNEDLKTIMNSWIYQEGHPILHVKRDYLNQTIEIKQERFYLGESFQKRNFNNQTWYIPVNYATEKTPDFNTTVPNFWLKDVSVNIFIPAESEQWILFNKQQTGNPIFSTQYFIRSVIRF